MWLEFGLAVLGNFQISAWIVFGISVLATGVLWSVFCEGGFDSKDLPFKWLKRALCAVFVSLSIVLLPSIDDLWKVRIGLIKLQLASPQNVQKGAEEIGRIAKKLECKYLGCEEEKKK